jgi:hypothetical protein
MRFMVIVKATERSEAGVLPTKEEFAEMGAFNEELVKAGIMLSGDGLQPTSKASRIKFAGSKPTIVDGPFAETKELVAGFWLLQAKSKAEVIEWMSRAPFDKGEEIEIRPFYEMEDLADVCASENGTK